MKVLPVKDREVLESLGIDGIEILNKRPNNFVELVDAKLLIFKV